MDMTKVKELWEKVKGFFKNMSMKMRIILCAAVTAVLIAIVALAVWSSSSSPYTTLFTNLSSTEASAILSYLQENNFTDYRLEGDTIFVRAGQEDILTAQLVQAGYPKNGALYETYFDKVGMTTTQSEANEIKRIALEQRLGAIIRSFDGVRDAQVSISLGRNQTYVLDDNPVNTTASVKVDMVPGYTLSQQQAQSIKNFVKHAVADLKIEEVFLTDSAGNPYAADAVTDLNNSSQLKLSLEEYYRNTICASIMQIMEPVYGPGNVNVTASVVVDVNRRVLENTEYSQPEGSYDAGGLMGRETVLGIVSSDGVEVVGGIPGTTTNSDVDIPTYMEDLLQAAGDGTYGQWYKDVTNQLNESKEQVEVIAGTVTDIRVAVTINQNSPTAADTEAPVVAETVATAAGIGGEDPASRVAVLIAPFYETPVEPVEPFLNINPDLVPYIIIGIAALMILLVLLLVILRGRKKRKEQKELEQAAIEEQLSALGSEEAAAAAAANGVAVDPETGAPLTGADIMEINTEKSMELRKTVRQFAQNNPEIAAQMVKAWLKGDDNG